MKMSNESQNNSITSVLFSPENMTKFEEMLNNERDKYTSRIFHENQYYIEILKCSKYTYNDHTFTFTQINKMIYFTYKDINQEWKIRNRGRH
jgi:hypothetical protein